MTLPRTDILMNRIRQESDITDNNSLNDFILLNYMNDAQRTIQNIVFQADQLNNVFTGRTIITAVPGQIEYELPFTVYAENSIISVWTIDSNNKPLLRYDKQAFGERASLRGYAVQNRTIILSNTPSNDILIIYNTRLPLMSDRVGSITHIEYGGDVPLALTEDYATDAGFTYNAADAEFSAGDLNTLPSNMGNATFGATYTDSVDGVWGIGDLSATVSGGAAVSGGVLQLRNAGDYVTYDTSAKLGNATGAVRFKWTPNYSGSSATFRPIFSEGNVGNSNAFVLQHVGTVIQLGMYGFASFATIHSFTPVSGTEYIFELNYDFLGGDTNLFIDGVKGTTQVISAARGATGTSRFNRDISIAANSIGDINDVLFFGAPQHTVDYAPDYTVEEYAYPEVKVDLPNFPDVGGITVADVVSILNTGTVGSLKYIIDNQYWSGLAWLPSDGTYLQATTESTINANMPSLILAASQVIPVSVVFEESDTVSTISNTDLNILEVVLPFLTLGDIKVGFEDTEEYISIVDKYGTAVLNNLYIDEFNSPDISLEGSIDAITVNDYVVAGKDATSHSCLPEECETYLKTFVQRKALAHINSKKISNSDIFTREEREDLITLFEDKHSDIEYPTIVDYDFLDY